MCGAPDGAPSRVGSLPGRGRRCHRGACAVWRKARCSRRRPPRLLGAPRAGPLEARWSMVQAWLERRRLRCRSASGFCNASSISSLPGAGRRCRRGACAAWRQARRARRRPSRLLWELWERVCALAASGWLLVAGWKVVVGSLGGHGFFEAIVEQ